MQEDVRLQGLEKILLKKCSGKNVIEISTELMDIGKKDLRKNKAKFMYKIYASYL